MNLKSSRPTKREKVMPIHFDPNALQRQTSILQLGCHLNGPLSERGDWCQQLESNAYKNWAALVLMWMLPIALSCLGTKDRIEKLGCIGF